MARVLTIVVGTGNISMMRNHGLKVSEESGVTKKVVGSCFYIG